MIGTRITKDVEAPHDDFMTQNNVLLFIYNKKVDFTDDIKRIV